MVRVLVPVKRVVDPNVKINVKPDGTGVELTNVKMTINPFDEMAVEEAVRMKESRKAAEVVVVSIGSIKVEETRRTALGMGADRAVLVETDAPLEPLSVAKILKGVCEEERSDLIIVGKQAVDDDANQTGQMLAAFLGSPQATFASEIQVDHGFALVTQEGDGGGQTVKLRLPAVSGSINRDKHHCRTL